MWTMGLSLVRFVGDVPGVGSKAEDVVCRCIGDGVGPNMDVWDCYDGSVPSKSVDWLL